MNRHRSLLQAIIRGRSDANIRFDDLRTLLRRLDFEERTKASHHVFRKEGIPVLLNLQRRGSQAKPYQVKQVRELILGNYIQKYQYTEAGLTVL